MLFEGKSTFDEKSEDDFFEFWREFTRQLKKKSIVLTTTTTTTTTRTTLNQIRLNVQHKEGFDEMNKLYVYLKANA